MFQTRTYGERAFSRDRLIRKYTLVQRIRKAFSLTGNSGVRSVGAKLGAVTIARIRFLCDNRTLSGLTSQ
jgi:hypothetical protein